MPIGKLNNVMTSHGEWKQFGMGETGDSYLVGKDGLLRSTPRPFVENSADYVKQLETNGVNKETLSNNEISSLWSR